MHAPLPSPARLALAPDGTIEGYASLFCEIDQARDMVMPGAFTQTLKQRGIRKIPMLFQHDSAEPVGIWLELWEDLRGLWARGRLIPDVRRARELLALLQAGAVDGLSIGYRTQRARIEMVRAVLREVDDTVPLREVHATRGKYLRADPVAALYEQGKAKHVGCFPDLEDEMCDFGIEGLSSGRSPDRLDAMVWGITSLITARASGGPRIRQL